MSEFNSLTRFKIIKNIEEKINLNEFINCIYVVCPACEHLIYDSHRVSFNLLYTGKTSNRRCSHCGCVLSVEYNVQAVPAKPKIKIELEDRLLEYIRGREQFWNNICTDSTVKKEDERNIIEKESALRELRIFKKELDKL